MNDYRLIEIIVINYIQQSHQLESQLMGMAIFCLACSFFKARLIYENTSAFNLHLVSVIWQDFVLQSKFSQKLSRKTTSAHLSTLRIRAGKFIC